MRSAKPDSIFKEDGSQLAVYEHVHNQTAHLTLLDTLAKMDKKAANILLSGGKQLRDTVRKDGGVRIQTEDEETIFTAILGIRDHTPFRTSLKRLTAAAGLWYASHLLADSKFLEKNPVISSLAEGHGLTGLKDKDPMMYVLYNIGIEYEAEIEDHLPRVAALLAWKSIHGDILFKSDKVGVSNSGAYEDLFRAACVFIESHLSSNRTAWLSMKERTRPFCAILKDFTVTREGGRTARSLLCLTNFDKYFSDLFESSK